MKIKTDNGEEIAIEFAEGFFDTPEEMQEMLNAVFVFGKIKDGTFFDEAEELDEEEADEIMERLDDLKPKHTLQ